MMSTEQGINDLLNMIEENCDPSIASKQCNDFMLESLSLIREKSPTIALEATEVAQEYFAGRVKIQAVSDMLVKCWHHIDENYKGVDSRHAEVSAIRAVIFPLDAQRHTNERDIVDYLSSFLTFINQVEPHLDEEEALLRKHFGKCIEVTANYEPPGGARVAG
jgi:hypothetical protein